jgi:acetyl-CoA carboxylase carboxyl transferase subunit beta
MKWFIKPRYTIVKPQSAAVESEAGQSQWTKCVCGGIIYAKDLDANRKVCPACGHHFRMALEERISLLTEAGSFTEINPKITSADPLEFKDSSGAYLDKVRKSIAKTKHNEAVVTGSAMIGPHAVTLSVMDFNFLGGSMGSDVGEKIFRAIMHSVDHGIPCIIVSCSGGARMHEGILSLMQMAKTSAALAKLAEKRIPYISILTDPTTGGVTASFAMLGDVNIAEPNALIGFAGPRVIEQNNARGEGDYRDDDETRRGDACEGARVRQAENETY